MSYFITSETPARRGRLRAPIGQNAWMVDIFGSVDTAGDGVQSTVIVLNVDMERWTFFETYWDMQACLQRQSQTTLKDVMPGILASCNPTNEA